MAKSTLEGLAPKKRPRQPKANTRGAGSAEALLPEPTGDDPANCRFHR